MPGLNRKGPEGKGPQTGRGIGKCTNHNSSEQSFGRGMAYGKRMNRNDSMGFGKCFGRNNNGQGNK